MRVLIFLPIIAFSSQQDNKLLSSYHRIPKPQNTNKLAKYQQARQNPSEFEISSFLYSIMFSSWVMSSSCTMSSSLFPRTNIPDSQQWRRRIFSYVHIVLLNHHRNNSSSNNNNNNNNNHKEPIPSTFSHSRDCICAIMIKSLSIRPMMTNPSFLSLSAEYQTPSREDFPPPSFETIRVKSNR